MMDRRRLTRYEVEEYYPVVERETDRAVGRLANLSIEGVMLITEEPVKKRTLLKLTLKLPTPVLGHATVEFDAECRWSRKGRGVDWFESGYRLKNVPIEDQTTILCLVMQLLADKTTDQELA
ncbi:MAG: PilZ domain-containing protein [candidate division Zixibacteria bacterium]|nr:PilZ domain-containing protein [candidate division Zixibacteria bacterium]MDH3937448.1 PilZ domain-containing protein [candidate division Zixibacteria bacterium]MDH4034407.1 PilZ domain-containing protein [candidate division Zixibacteria bacterium]